MSELENVRLRAKALQLAVPPPEDDQLTWRYAAQMVALDSLQLADRVEKLEQAILTHQQHTQGGIGPQDHALWDSLHEA